MLRTPYLRAVCAGVLLAAPAAQAQTTYTDRTAFLAALLTTGSNDLDGVAIPDPPGTTSTVPGLDFGFTTANLLDPAPDPVFATSILQPGLGTNQLWSVSDGGITRVQFASGVNGFGARFSALGSLDNVIFRFFAGGSEIGSETFLQVDSGYDGFYGVAIGSGFDRVDIEGVPSEHYEMDDLAAGLGIAAVPEPSTVTLVAAGAGVLLARRRRRAPATLRARGTGDA